MKSMSLAHIMKTILPETTTNIWHKMEILNFVKLPSIDRKYPVTEKDIH